MSEFNRMTLLAAAQVVADFNTHSQMELLEVQWGIEDQTNTQNLSTRSASWARLSINQNPLVFTENGEVEMSRAMLDEALKAPPNTRNLPIWNKLTAGLKLDGFEIIESEQAPADKPSWMLTQATKPLKLMRMFPTDSPELDLRVATNEVDDLLVRYEFSVARGHLEQAMSAFQRGEWAGANAQMRSFFESYLNEAAEKLGYSGSENTDEKRAFLGQLEPPFLLATYNEWHLNKQKPQFVQGLWSRMHPEGSHPGLSEEEDATFRLQITLITARLFLRRYHKRKAAAQ